MPESEFRTKLGKSIHTYHWKSRESNGAAIFILHGYAEYGGRYKNTAAHFNESGFDVFAIDHQGHGRSYGKHGLVQSWQQLLDDAHQAFNHIKSQHPEFRQWFLIGHSMGGGLAALLSERISEDLDGVLLSAPLIDQATSTPAFLISIGKLIAKVMPGLGVIPFDQSAQSRDPDVIKLFNSDPNNYTGKLRAGTGNQMLEMIKVIDQLPERLSTPFWIGHSSIDRLTSFEASKSFYERLASSDKTFRKYDGLFHEIMNEPEKRIVLEEMSQWLRKRLKKQAY